MSENQDKGDLVIIETSAPIPINDLKRKFKENVQFVVDYDKSTFKGDTFLTYLTNLNLNCRVTFSSKESQLELLKSYLNSALLVKFGEMEDLAINLLLFCRGELNFLDFDPESFINENEEIIEQWLKRVLSLMVFALHINPSTKALVEQFEIDEDENLRGINFVQLIDHELFPNFFKSVEQRELSWNPMLFDKYCFAGKNLFHYFASKRNPLFIGLLAIAEPDGVKKLEEAANNCLLECQELLKGIEHVPSV